MVLSLYIDFLEFHIDKLNSICHVKIVQEIQKSLLLWCSQKFVFQVTLVFLFGTIACCSSCIQGLQSVGIVCLGGKPVCLSGASHIPVSPHQKGHFTEDPIGSYEATTQCWVCLCTTRDNTFVLDDTDERRKGLRHHPCPQLCSGSHLQCDLCWPWGGFLPSGIGSLTQPLPRLTGATLLQRWSENGEKPL